MNKERKLDKIIHDHLPAIRNGHESLDSVLAMFSEDASTLRPRLEAALWLVSLRKSLEPRPGFILSSRKHLEQRIASTSPKSALQRLLSRYSPQRWVFNLTAPIVLVLLAALIINSLVLTARLSIPGDALYSTKLAIEDTRLIFTFNPVNKSNLYLQFTRERTTEFVELVLEGEYELLPNAAARMETDMIATLHFLNTLSKAEPTIEMPIEHTLRDSLSSEIIMLRVLEDTSPPSAHPGIELAIEVAKSGVMALR